jgi:hypothetical protein
LAYPLTGSGGNSEARSCGWHSENAYENRIILFLDFLGFKEIVERTEADRQYLHNLLDAIDLLHQVARDDAELSKSQRITTFSDSVVLSYAVDEESAVFYLLTDVTFAIIDLAIKGFIVRGAITLGKLIHTNKYLVGPAMIHAYELESKVAKYPRVLVDAKLISVARKAHASHHTRTETDFQIPKDHLDELKSHGRLKMRRSHQAPLWQLSSPVVVKACEA